MRELIDEQERAVRTAGFFSHRPTLDAAVEASQTELAELVRIDAGDPQKIQELRKELTSLHTELQRINDAQTEINDASGLFRFFSQFSPENLHQLEQADIAINKQIDSTEGLLSAAVAAADGVVEAEREKAAAQAAAKENTKSTKDAKIAWVDYNDAIKNAILAIKAYDTEQKRLSAESDMWAELAKGADGYGDTLEILSPKVTSLEDEHQTLFQSIEQDIADTNASLWELIGTYDRWVVSQRGGITDVSGTLQPPGGDAAAAMRRISQPVDIENNRRSYATSPRGNDRGTQSDVFLGIDQKVWEFEQVTDISIDKLDELSAQTQHTAEELEKLNQKELAEFSKSLFDIVNTIDTLTPVLEGFGVDLSSQRSHGRLAVNTAAGVGQVSSGDVIGGLSNIIMSMWEWGQPDRDALQQQHVGCVET